MIIVTGVGRSGTSLMITYLKALGLKVNFGNWYKKFCAGNEDPNSVFVNSALIRSRNIGFDLGKKQIKFLMKKISKMKQDAIKDPLFVADTKLINFWSKCRDDLHVIYMRRNPKEIVKSQKRAMDMNTPAYRCFSDLIIRKEKSFFRTVKLLKIPIQIIDFENIKLRIVIQTVINFHKGFKQPDNYINLWRSLYAPSIKL